MIERPIEIETAIVAYLNSLQEYYLADEADAKAIIDKAVVTLRVIQKGVKTEVPLSDVMGSVDEDGNFLEGTDVQLTLQNGRMLRDLERTYSPNKLRKMSDWHKSIVQSINFSAGASVYVKNPNINHETINIIQSKISNELNYLVHYPAKQFTPINQDAINTKIDELLTRDKIDSIANAVWSDLERCHIETTKPTSGQLKISKKKSAEEKVVEKLKKKCMKFKEDMGKKYKNSDGLELASADLYKILGALDKITGKEKEETARTRIHLAEVAIDIIQQSMTHDSPKSENKDFFSFFKSSSSDKNPMVGLLKELQKRINKYKKSLPSIVENKEEVEIQNRHISLKKSNSF